MNETRNGYVPEALVRLADRLVEPDDRKTYAELLSLFRSVPEGDDLLKLAHLLGFTTLMGQRLPESMTEFLEAFRNETKLAREQRAQLESRLAGLPAEFAAGIRLEDIASELAERFRQQVAATSLPESAALLRLSAGEIQTLSGQITANVTLVLDRFRDLAATLTAELAQLSMAAHDLTRQNAVLVRQNRSQARRLLPLIAMLCFLTGMICTSFIRLSAGGACLAPASVPAQAAKAR